MFFYIILLIIIILYFLLVTRVEFIKLFRNRNFSQVPKLQFLDLTATLIFQLAFISFFFGVVVRSEPLSTLGIMTIIMICYFKLVILGIKMIRSENVATIYGNPNQPIAKIAGVILLIFVTPLFLFILIGYFMEILSRFF